MRALGSITTIETISKDDSAIITSNDAPLFVIQAERYFDAGGDENYKVALALGRVASDLGNMNGVAIEAKILLEELSDRFDPVSRSKRIRYTGQANNSHDESLKAYNLLYRKGASEGDQIAGFKAAEQAAFQGSLSATYLISQCYLTGQGVDKDPNLALIHAKKLGINKYSYGEDDASIFVREAEKYLAMEGVDNHKAALALAQRAGSLGSAAGIAIEAQ